MKHSPDTNVGGFGPQTERFSMLQPIIHHPTLAGRFPCDDSLAVTSGDDECTDTEAEAGARHRRRANDGVLRASDGTLYTHDPRAATCGGCLVEEVKRLERDLRATQRQVEYHAKNANGYYRELTSRGWTATHGWPAESVSVDRGYCEKCSSTDVAMCTGYRQFATITLACSCSCHAAVRVPSSSARAPSSPAPVATKGRGIRRESTGGQNR